MTAPRNVILIAREEAERDIWAEPFRLMLRARWRALCHIRFGFPRRGCGIWRIYSHLGLKTYRVLCQCGKEFK